jgi:hypothetical protein
MGFKGLDTTNKSQLYSSVWRHFYHMIGQERNFIRASYHRWLERVLRLHVV